ncbi:hypothetical protein [Mucilaginibacter pocheonensis]|uniref:Uncharacterized protein n=1 Tax=Mucilaginibacter pocheonensis TaxID=398050 RepID=A0ABU1TAP1_9SPHI|nr:hypothetical protein [Mucilaginibacter pocheonensis]MDR6942404.1 hypothetical protein [Mucilaginibacter pocheonensis]
MKPLSIKYMLPLGLFLLALSFVVKFMYPALPDSIYGLFMGFSTGAILLSIIQGLYLRKQRDRFC